MINSKFQERWSAKALSPAGILMAEKQGIRSPRAVRYHIDIEGPSSYCWSGVVCPCCRMPMGPHPVFLEDWMQEELFVYACECGAVSLAADTMDIPDTCDIYLSFAGSATDFGIIQIERATVISVDALDTIFSRKGEYDATKN